jgi:hypothetical protein
MGILSIICTRYKVIGARPFDVMATGAKHCPVSPVIKPEIANPFPTARRKLCHIGSQYGLVETLAHNQGGASRAALWFFAKSARHASCPELG